MVKGISHGPSKPLFQVRILVDVLLLRDGAARLAHRAHNPKVVGSNPAPAPIYARQLSLVQNKSDQLE